MLAELPESFNASWTSWMIASLSLAGVSFSFTSDTFAN
jgi:hypothetical protein